MRSFNPYKNRFRDFKYYSISKISSFLCKTGYHNWIPSTENKGYWCIECGIDFQTEDKK